MSYISIRAILTVEVKEESDWTSKDTNNAYALLEATKVQIELLLGHKFNVKIEYE